jgi:hypothetical protein
MCSKLKVTLWASGTPEQFILHVRSSIHACNQMEHNIKFSRAKEAVANAMLDLEKKGGACANSQLRERKRTKGNQEESVLAASESLAAAKSAYDKAN